MALNKVKDIECDDISIKSDADILSLDATGANITTATLNSVTATTINASTVTTTTVTATNVNFKLGQLQRSFGVATGKDDIAATGAAPVKFTFPAKAYIRGFGFQSTGSDVVIATTFNAILTTSNATVLGTAFVGVGDYTLGTADATKTSFSTATSVRANHGVYPTIATAGVSGSVHWFVDYRLQST